jgi:hypothetical protein
MLRRPFSLTAAPQNARDFSMQEFSELRSMFTKSDRLGDALSNSSIPSYNISVTQLSSMNNSRRSCCIFLSQSGQLLWNHTDFDSSSDPDAALSQILFKSLSQVAGDPASTFPQSIPILLDIERQGKPLVSKLLCKLARPMVARLLSLEKVDVIVMLLA